MSETKLEKERVRGFAGLLASGLLPLNEKKKFKEQFANTDIKILLNAVNVNFAALIIIKNGVLRVESIPNKPKENLKKKKLGWDALLAMDTQTYLALAMNRLPMSKLGLKVLTGKVKVRGLRKLLVLKKMLLLLSETE
ncbi:MAG: hypothetical protein ACFFDK_08900 [Promethearchaeota archaeon]